MFKKIPQTIIKVLTPKQKFHKLMTDVGGVWYIEKIANGLTPSNTSKLC